MLLEPEKSGQGSAGIIEGAAVDSVIMFSNHKGVYKRGIEKRQRRLLGKLSFMRPFLNDDEKILLVTTGCSPVSFGEQLLGGWVVFYLKRCVLVFTNKRIFHIPTKGDFSYRQSISQIMYGDCRSIVMKGRTLVVKYESGKKEKFLYMYRSERKKIKVLLGSIALQGERSSALQRTHLCPRCGGVLVKDYFQCPECKVEFKNMKEAWRISVLYPGGGYFYTRHPWLGAADAVTETYLSVLVIVTLVDVIRGVEESMFAFWLFAVILGFEKVVTVYHSNHFIEEYIPKDRHIRFGDETTEALEGAKDAAKPGDDSALWVR